MQAEKTSKKKIIFIIVCILIAVWIAVTIGIRTSRKYRVHLVDQDGAAVSGGTLQFETGSSSETVSVDSDGTAVIPYDAKTYGIRVLAVPDGYLNDPSKSYQVSSDEREINITIKSIGADPFQFETTDIDGNPVSSEDFRDAKVILINFWEPWCGPCIAEMPELSELYEKYKEEGLVILGVYTDTSDDAEAVVSDYDISYPILHSSGDLTKYQTMYVPTSIFVSGEGKVLSSEEIVGAHSYEEWEEMILSYLDES